jgi:hypothetical protein
MCVIGHQAPGEAAHFVNTAGVTQHLNVVTAVALRHEDALLSITALNDMMCDVRNDDPCGSGQMLLRKSGPSSAI